MYRFILNFPAAGDSDVAGISSGGDLEFAESSPTADVGRQLLLNMIKNDGREPPPNLCLAAAGHPATLPAPAAEILEILAVTNPCLIPERGLTRILSSPCPAIAAYCRTNNLTADWGFVEPPDAAAYLSADFRAAMTDQKPATLAVITATTLLPQANPGSPMKNMYFKGRQKSQCYLTACAVSATVPVLAPGATLIVKVLDVFSAPCWFALLTRLSACFTCAQLVKPLASSPLNSELYFVGLNYVPKKEHLIWAATLPAACFTWCPLSMSPCAATPGCRRGVVYPAWAHNLVPVYRDVAQTIHECAQNSAKWCSPAQIPLWLHFMKPYMEALE